MFRGTRTKNAVSNLEMAAHYRIQLRHNIKNPVFVDIVHDCLFACIGVYRYIHTLIITHTHI